MLDVRQIHRGKLSVAKICHAVERSELSFQWKGYMKLTHVWVCVCVCVCASVCALHCRSSSVTNGLQFTYKLHQCRWAAAIAAVPCQTRAANPAGRMKCLKTECAAFPSHPASFKRARNYAPTRLHLTPFPGYYGFNEQSFRHHFR